MKSISADIQQKNTMFFKIYYIIMGTLTVLGFLVNNDFYGSVDGKSSYMLTFYGIEYYYHYAESYWFGEYDWVIGPGDYLFVVIIILLVVSLLPFVISKVSRLIMLRLKLTVNEERAFGSYGKFTKKDFAVPIEQITSITISNSIFDKLRSGKTIVIKSASSMMLFPFVQNADDVLNFTLERIKEYKANYGNPKPLEIAQSVRANKTISTDTDELRQLKLLLDDGVITQKEFDAKKKQILGV